MIDPTLSLLSSSAFTIYWNLGNLITFNLYCTNVFTEESLARYSCDHWPRGEVFNIALQTLNIAMMILSIIHDFKYEPHPENFDEPSLRPEDILYIAEWTTNHHLIVPFNDVEIDLINPQINSLLGFIDVVNNSIDEGAAFFKEFILDSGQIDEDTKTQVLEFDPETYIFVLTRSIYICIFGPKGNERIPSFFKLQTRQLIENLRKKYGIDLVKTALEPLMQNLLSFNADQDDVGTRAVLNSLKKVAQGELQNSLFTTKCWQKACQEFDQEIPQSPDMIELEQNEI